MYDQAEKALNQGDIMTSTVHMDMFSFKVLLPVFDKRFKKLNQIAGGISVGIKEKSVKR